MSNLDHHDDCGCWMCEDDRESRGEETRFGKENREANERAAQELAASGYKCLCTDPYAAFHSFECMQRNRTRTAK